MNDQNSVNLVLRKRLNTCRNANGNLLGIPDELIMDIIKTWEQWPGTGKSFYSSIGIKKEQMANIIKKGKRLFKEGYKPGTFTSVQVKVPSQTKAPIVLNLDKNKTLRFYQVDQLMEFLKLSS